ncbi:MAG: InlB B-repeat-containing protein [Christensenellaceae bacterium]|nr:InlB B-repeat-containing protein [Christensenellaceae bacterium]
MKKHLSLKLFCAGVIAMCLAGICAVTTSLVGRPQGGGAVDASIITIPGSGSPGSMSSITTSAGDFLSNSTSYVGKYLGTTVVKDTDTVQFSSNYIYYIKLAHNSLTKDGWYTGSATARITRPPGRPGERVYYKTFTGYITYEIKNVTSTSSMINGVKHYYAREKVSGVPGTTDSTGSHYSPGDGKAPSWWDTAKNKGSDPATPGNWYYASGQGPGTAGGAGLSFGNLAGIVGPKGGTGSGGAADGYGGGETHIRGLTTITNVTGRLDNLPIPFTGVAYSLYEKPRPVTFNTQNRDIRTYPGDVAEQVTFYGWSGVNVVDGADDYNTGKTAVKPIKFPGGSQTPYFHQNGWTDVNAGGVYGGSTTGKRYYGSSGGLTAVFGGEKGGASSLTLWPQWEQNKLTLKFDANGGLGTKADTTGITAYGTGATNYNTNGKTPCTVAFPTNTFTRPGFTFDGWHVGAVNSADVWSSSTATRTVAGDLGTKTNSYGKSLADLNTTTNNNSGASIIPDPVAITLHAKWKPISYKLEFKGDAGVDLDDELYTGLTYTTQKGTNKGATFGANNNVANNELPTAPTKPGWTFIGWSAAEEYYVKSGGSASTPSTLTLNPGFTAKGVIYLYDEAGRRYINDPDVPETFHGYLATRGRNDNEDYKGGFGLQSPGTVNYNHLPEGYGTWSNVNNCYDCYIVGPDYDDGDVPIVLTANYRRNEGYIILDGTNGGGGGYWGMHDMGSGTYSAPNPFKYEYDNGAYQQPKFYFDDDSDTSTVSIYSDAYDISGSMFTRDGWTIVGWQISDQSRRGKVGGGDPSVGFSIRSAPWYGSVFVDAEMLDRTNKADDPALPANRRGWVDQFSDGNGTTGTKLNGSKRRGIEEYLDLMDITNAEILHGDCYIVLTPIWSPNRLKVEYFSGNTDSNTPHENLGNEFVITDNFGLKSDGNRRDNAPDYGDVGSEDYFETVRADYLGAQGMVARTAGLEFYEIYIYGQEETEQAFVDRLNLGAGYSRPGYTHAGWWSSDPTNPMMRVGEINKFSDSGFGKLEPCAYLKAGVKYNPQDQFYFDENEYGKTVLSRICDDSKAQNRGAANNVELMPLWVVNTYKLEFLYDAYVNPSLASTTTRDWRQAEWAVSKDDLYANKRDLVLDSGLARVENLDFIYKTENDLTNDYATGLGFRGKWIPELEDGHYDGTVEANKYALNVPYKRGHNFVGWYTDPEYNHALFSDGRDVTVTGDEGNTTVFKPYASKYDRHYSNYYLDPELPLNTPTVDMLSYCQLSTLALEYLRTRFVALHEDGDAEGSNGFAPGVIKLFAKFIPQEYTVEYKFVQSQTAPDTLYNDKGQPYTVYNTKFVTSSFSDGVIPPEGIPNENPTLNVPPPPAYAAYPSTHTYGVDSAVLPYPTAGATDYDADAIDMTGGVLDTEYKFNMWVSNTRLTNEGDIPTSHFSSSDLTQAGQWVSAGIDPSTGEEKQNFRQDIDPITKKAQWKMGGQAHGTEGFLDNIILYAKFTALYPVTWDVNYRYGGETDANGNSIINTGYGFVTLNMIGEGGILTDYMNDERFPQQWIRDQNDTEESALVLYNPQGWAIPKIPNIRIIDGAFVLEEENIVYPEGSLFLEFLGWTVQPYYTESYNVPGYEYRAGQPMTKREPNKEILGTMHPDANIEYNFNGGRIEFVARWKSGQFTVKREYLGRSNSDEIFRNFKQQIGTDALASPTYPTRQTMPTAFHDNMTVGGLNFYDVPLYSFAWWKWDANAGGTLSNRQAVATHAIERNTAMYAQYDANMEPFRNVFDRFMAFGYEAKAKSYVSVYNEIFADTTSYAEARAFYNNASLRAPVAAGSAALSNYGTQARGHMLTLKKIADDMGVDLDREYDPNDAVFNLRHARSIISEYAEYQDDRLFLQSLNPCDKTNIERYNFISLLGRIDFVILTNQGEPNLREISAMEEDIKRDFEFIGRWIQGKWGVGPGVDCGLMPLGAPRSERDTWNRQRSLVEEYCEPDFVKIDNVIANNATRNAFGSTAFATQDTPLSQVKRWKNYFIGSAQSANDPNDPFNLLKMDSNLNSRLYPDGPNGGWPVSKPATFPRIEEYTEYLALVQEHLNYLSSTDLGLVQSIKSVLTKGVGSVLNLNCFDSLLALKNLSEVLAYEVPLYGVAKPSFYEDHYNVEGLPVSKPINADTLQLVVSKHAEISQYRILDLMQKQELDSIISGMASLISEVEVAVGQGTYAGARTNAEGRALIRRARGLEFDLGILDPAPGVSSNFLKLRYLYDIMKEYGDMEDFSETPYDAVAFVNMLEGCWEVIRSFEPTDGDVNMKMNYIMAMLEMTEYTVPVHPFDPFPSFYSADIKGRYAEGWPLARYDYTDELEKLEKRLVQFETLLITPEMSEFKSQINGFIAEANQIKQYPTRTRIEEYLANANYYLTGLLGDDPDNNPIFGQQLKASRERLLDVIDIIDEYVVTPGTWLNAGQKTDLGARVDSATVVYKDAKATAKGLNDKTEDLLVAAAQNTITVSKVNEQVGTMPAVYEGKDYQIGKLTKLVADVNRHLPKMDEASALRNNLKDLNDAGQERLDEAKVTPTLHGYFVWRSKIDIERYLKANDIKIQDAKTGGGFDVLGLVLGLVFGMAVLASGGGLAFYFIKHPDKYVALKSKVKNTFKKKDKGVAGDDSNGAGTDKAEAKAEKERAKAEKAEAKAKAKAEKADKGPSLMDRLKSKSQSSEIPANVTPEITPDAPPAEPTV